VITPLRVADSKYLIDTGTSQDHAIEWSGVIRRLDFG
jgi:hypothetical protein